MDISDDPVVQRQRRLGQALAEWRKAAGLNQAQLARRLSYDRTTVAHAERGAQVPAEDFWRSCDQALVAGGTLLRLYQAVQEAKQRKADQAAARIRAERRVRLARSPRGDAASGIPARSLASWEPEPSGGLPDAGVVVRGGVPVDPQLPGTLQVLLVQYAKTDNMLGPRSLLPVVSAQVGLISRCAAVACATC